MVADVEVRAELRRREDEIRRPPRSYGRRLAAARAHSRQERLRRPATPACASPVRISGDRTTSPIRNHDRTGRATRSAFSRVSERRPSTTPARNSRNLHVAGRQEIEQRGGEEGTRASICRASHPEKSQEDRRRAARRRWRPHSPNSAIPAAASNMHDPAPITAWMKRIIVGAVAEQLVYRRQENTDRAAPGRRRLRRASRRRLSGAPIDGRPRASPIRRSKNGACEILRDVDQTKDERDERDRPAAGSTDATPSRRATAIGRQPWRSCACKSSSSPDATRARVRHSGTKDGDRVEKPPSGTSRRRPTSKAVDCLQLVPGVCATARRAANPWRGSRARRCRDSCLADACGPGFARVDVLQALRSEIRKPRVT